MKRTLRLLAALAIAVAVAAAGAALLARRGLGKSPALAFASASAPGGPGAVADGSFGAKPSATGAAYELEKLPVLSRAVYYVKENYVDQKRVDWKGMVFAALEGVEKQVAEVMVEGDPKAGSLKVTAGAATKEFDASHVATPQMARSVLSDVMGFLRKNLVGQKDLREIEYAAVNGMLGTLDPHSVLLDPKMFREMRLATKGEFGGLGFVISMRDGNLTVVRVLKNTPAARAGIKAKDVITRIDEQSTVNMDVQEAVDHLRGKPATRISITVQRQGWPEPRKLQLQREIIAVETVPQSKLLEGNVGFVKLTQFSANTTRDLVGALAQLRAQSGGPLKGLVLDLRGNPGGLLEQAIQVSDLFLSRGVIVKTVGEGGKMHEVKEASADKDDVVALPIVVVVNNSSASASEIVAGALKNNDRALVVGRQTFGKGSVQVLYDFSDPGRGRDDDVALKLTIAQYLTPGDVSIQEVGVTPDVLLLPGRALRNAVNYFAPQRMMGEADLERHFSNPAEAGLTDAERERRAKERADRTEKAALELRYLLDEKEDRVAKAMAQDERRAAAEKAHEGMPEITPEQQEDEELDQDELVEDYQVRFAREVLTRATSPDRAKLLEVARGVVAERKKDEGQRLAQKLGALGVDWAAGPAGGTPKAVVSVEPPAGKRAVAGETLPWTVTVENRGDGAFRRLRGWSRVEKNGLLDRREFVFGTVKPGEKRSWSVPVKLPLSLDSRHDAVQLVFEEENGNAPQPVQAGLDVLEVAKPAFAFSAQVEDDQGGNGDGLVQRGEKLTLRIDVKNEGPGPSGDKTYVSVKNLGDDKVFIEKGRQVLGKLAPGAVKSALLTLEVRKGFKPDAVPLRITVADEKSFEFVTERLELAIRPEVPKQPAAGAVRVRAAEALLRSAAEPDAAAIAVAKKGAVLPVQGRFGELYRVEWEKGRRAFVAAADVEQAGAKAAPPAAGAIGEAWQRQPPKITLSPDPAQGAPVVDGDKLRISGVASVPQGVPGARTRLRDLFVLVNDQKVFFKVLPEGGPTTKMEFQADLPLKPGNNTVTVFAREDEEFQARRTFYVYRRAAAEVAQGSPK